MADPITAAIAAIAAAGASAAGAVGIPLAVTQAVVGTIGTLTTTLTFQAGLVAGLMAWGTVASAAGVFTPKIAGPNRQMDWKADPYAPIPFIGGRTGVRGGKMIYEKRLGDDDEYHMTVSVFGGPGPYEGLESVSFPNPVDGAQDDPPVTVHFDADGEALSSPFTSHLWMRIVNGDFPQDAMTQPPGYTGEDFTDWTVYHKLQSLAGALIITDGDPGVYETTDIVAGMFVWKGGLMYDPRLDDTYPGGSGDHRWADPQTDPDGYETARATWTWSEDPWIGALNWGLGRWVRKPGTDDPWRLVQGIGARIALVEVANFVAAANVSDVNGWTWGGQLYSAEGGDGDSKWQALIALCQAGGGKPTVVGGKLSCTIPGPRVSIATLSGKDFVGQTFNTKGCKPRRERFNTCTPSYRSEDHGWQVVAADEFTIDAYVTPKLGIRAKALTYGLVQDVNQAAQLMHYDAADGYERGPISGTAKPRWGIGLRPSDCVTLDDPEFGLGGPTKVVCIGRSIDALNAEFPLTFQTETDAKHAAALAQTGTAPPV